MSIGTPVVVAAVDVFGALGPVEGPCRFNGPWGPLRAPRPGFPWGPFRQCASLDVHTLPRAPVHRPAPPRPPAWRTAPPRSVRAARDCKEGGDGPLSLIAHVDGAATPPRAFKVERRRWCGNRAIVQG